MVSASVACRCALLNWSALHVEAKQQFNSCGARRAVHWTRMRVSFLGVTGSYDRPAGARALVEQHNQLA